MQRNPTIALHTLGCKLNYAETAMIGRQFVERGFNVVAHPRADVAVINTCSVTARAEQECRQLIRRTLRKSPNTVVIVTGCYAQLQPEEVASLDGVDIVLGAKEKLKLFDYVKSFDKQASTRVFVSDIESVNDFGPAFSSDAADRTRAFLKIQDGCDFNCSFCTIPLARGASRSQSVSDCVAQAATLVAQGYKEIVLTGVNVGDYGKKTGSSLLDLLRHLVRVDGLQRIRISSIEPNLLSPELLEFIASHPTLCRHLHVPLQSGHDDILKFMRRRYTTRFYRDLMTRVKERIPECGIGVDVIVGFPGETDSHFDATFKFLSDLPVSYLHVFTYSERPNTPAAKFARAVEPGIRYARNRKLRILSQKKKRAFYEGIVGKTVSLLLEGRVEQGIRYGLTDNYVKVGIPAEATAANAIVTAYILGARDEACVGRIERKAMVA